MLGVDQQQLLERLQRGPRVVWLAQRVEREVARQLRDLAPAAVVEGFAVFAFVFALVLLGTVTGQGG